jgi:hypothetical protein
MSRETRFAGCSATEDHNALHCRPIPWAMESPRLNSVSASRTRAGSVTPT